MSFDDSHHIQPKASYRWYDDLAGDSQVVDVLMIQLKRSRSIYFPTYQLVRMSYWPTLSL